MPEVTESWKWRGVPVWEHRGILCTGETYKAVVKTTFAKGAALPDPAGLFNASLEGGTRRSQSAGINPYKKDVPAERIGLFSGSSLTGISRS